MTKPKNKSVKITEDMMEETEDFVIPELENARKFVRNIYWTEHDDKVMKKYYGKVPTQSIIDYFRTLYPPYGRSRASVEHRAVALRLTRKKEQHE